MPENTTSVKRRSRFAGVAPKGWVIPATCRDCGSTSRCYGDGEFWRCIRCWAEAKAQEEAA